MRQAVGRRFQGVPPEIRSQLQGEVRFAAFARIWSEVYVQSLKLSTREGYDSILKRALIPQFGDFLLEDIGLPAIDSFAAAEIARGVSKKTVNNVMGVLRRCLGVARAWGLIQTVPEIRMRTVAPSEIKYLTSTESQRLLAAAKGTRWWLFFLCALRTGLRGCELIGLHWEDIDIEGATIHVRRSRFHGVEDSPKNNRVGHQPMTSDVWQAFRAVGTARQGHVFTRPDGKPLSWDAAWRATRKFCRLAGLPHSGVHTFRHSYASQLTMEGIELIPLQHLMRHSSIQMTSRYAHLPRPFLRACAETLLRAEARLTGGHSEDTSTQLALTAPTNIMDSNLATVTTQTPPREEEALVVPRRGFENRHGARKTAKVGSNTYSLARTLPSQRGHGNINE